MRILVPVKRVVDYNVRVRARLDGSGVDLASVRMSMNPFDEVALEQALRLREAGLATEVVAVSAGNAACQETLRTALAYGADRAMLIETDAELQPLAVAKLLAAVCRRESPSLVLCGKQAIDDDCAQTGPMLAGLLDWPQAVAVSALTLAENEATVRCEVESGWRTLALTLPAVVSVDLTLNEPRYVTLPNIIKAKKKPIEAVSPEDLGVNVAARLSLLKVTEPPARKAGVRLGSAEELVRALRAAKVLA